MISERYRRWFEYEQDSHAKVLASLQSVPEQLRSEPFQKAVDLMAHLVAARLLWLNRLGHGSRPAELFPSPTALADLPELVDEMQSAWSGYLNNLTDEQIARRFEYKSQDGEKFSNTIDDVLTQLFGHSLYHRGQIAMILRSIGAEPAVTDFVFWSRERVMDG